MTRPKPTQRSPEWDFKIFKVTTPGMFRSYEVMILSKDIQSAISTFPNGVLAIEQMPRTILINKAVAKEICEHFKKQRKVLA